jgi:hypothetical protein
MAESDLSTDILKKVVQWVTPQEIDRLRKLLREQPGGFHSLAEDLGCAVKFQEAV